MRLEGIPMVPSMNHAYAGTFRRYKSKEVIVWERQFSLWSYHHRNEIDSIRKHFKDPEMGQVIHIHCEYYFKKNRIYCKNGKPKKLDTSNRIKLLHDQIADLIGYDDCYFFDGSFIKRHTEEVNEFVNVELQWVRLGDNGYRVDQDQQT